LHPRDADASSVRRGAGPCGVNAGLVTDETDGGDISRPGAAFIGEETSRQQLKRCRIGRRRHDRRWFDRYVDRGPARTIITTDIAQARSAARTSSSSERGNESYSAQYPKSMLKKNPVAR
jgi:hypothetical protein